MGGEVQPPPPKPSPTKIDHTSPFFLGTGDRPGDYITPNRLRTDNYDDWAGDIQLELEARHKFDFLDGSIHPYTSSDWITVNAMLVSWIMNTIDPKVKGTLTKYREAKRLWDHLKARFPLLTDLGYNNFGVILLIVVKLQI